MLKRSTNNAHPSARCFDCGFNNIFEQQYGAAMPIDSAAPVWESATPNPNQPTWRGGQ